MSPVDPETVLDGVNSLDVATWEYDTQEDVLHMGPMAEDFYETFGLGHDRERITNVDADGVALAAIQGLSQKLDDKEMRIDDLETDLDAKDARIEDQRDRIDRLESTVERKDDRIDELEAETEALHEETEALREETETLREETATLREENDRLRDRLAEIESRLGLQAATDGGIEDGEQ